MKEFAEIRVTYLVIDHMKLQIFIYTHNYKSIFKFITIMLPAKDDL